MTKFPTYKQLLQGVADGSVDGDDLGRARDTCKKVERPLEAENS